MNWAGVARGRCRLIRNTLLPRGRRLSARGRARPLLGAALALALGGLVCLALASLFGQLAADGATAAEAAAVVALVLTAALIGLLVFDLHAGVSALVADSDLELLRRAPVPPGSLFLIKLGDALPRTSMLLVALAIPAAIAYHVAYPLPLWAWAAYPLQLFSLWAIPLGIGTAASIELLRHVPARRAREALGLLSTLTLVLLWLANSFLLPQLAETTDDPLGRMRDALSGSAPVYRYSPGSWAAQALASATQGSAAGAAQATGLLVLAAALSLGGAAAVAGRFLESAQAKIAAGGGGRRAPASRPRRAEAGSPIPGAQAASRRLGGLATEPPRGGPAGRILFAVLRRDARLWLRDWTALGDVLTAAILWTLLPLVGAPLHQASTHTLARAMMLALTVGLGYEVGARALPFERRGGTWMSLAPVPAWQWIAAKLAGAAMLSVPLMLLAASSMSLTMGLSARHVVEILCLALPALGLSLSVGLWTGLAFGHLEWTNPRAMLTTTGRVVATVLLLTQALAWLLFAQFAEHPGLGLPAGFPIWAPTLLAAPLAVWPLGAAAGRLSRREWGG